MFCPNCGNQCGPHDNVCTQCGTPLRSPAAAPLPTKNDAKKRNVLVAALAGVCVVLVVLIVLVAGGLGGAKGATQPEPQDDTTSGDAIQSVGGGTNVAAAIDPKTGKTIVALKRPSFINGQGSSASSAAKPQVASYEVSAGLANVTNLADTYLTDDEKSALERYGFVVDTSAYSDEFYEVYEMNRYNLSPNFVTVDSLMHTYHLYFQHLQKNTERYALSDTIRTMSQAMLQASAAQYDDLKGSEWESAAKRNVAFFAVGALLQDESTQVPPFVADEVKTEVAAINSASGKAKSAVTGQDEDYTQYKPRGYYEGDATLEAYFRTMMWYGRMNFTQSDEDLDRSALLMTMALKGEALSNWEAVYAVTSFFAGASDDCGYYEYEPIIEAVYGEGATAADLVGNDSLWENYHEITALMPAPQINSVPLGSDDDPKASRTEEEKGYRFMGQRFTLDEMIFTKLLYPEVGTNASGAGRLLPDALDVPAALGSDVALDLDAQRGATSFEGFQQNMDALRTQLSDEDDPRWSASLYSQWLYTINPLLATKGEGYPSFMQSEQWQRKSLQTYLGSYTELKHDTVLYAKQVMAEMGGGPIDERDDRGYVEPEPEVFARLANLTKATSEGLASYNLLASDDQQNLALLQELAEQLATIANKELSGETVTDAEYDIIRTYGGQLEHFWQEVYKDEAENEYFTSRDFPAAVVVDVATNGQDGTVLELGTGRASTIYVVVPVDGSLRIASGSVFSFYQFEQPMSDRLTDTEWRQMMGIEMTDSGQYQTPSKQTEDWTRDFSVSRF